jgi:hypothetical protein
MHLLVAGIFQSLDYSAPPRSSRGLDTYLS